MKKALTVFVTVFLLCTAGCSSKPVPGADISTEVPVFSMPSGIYEQPVKLELSSENNFDIYYTTDGSVPTRNSRRYRRTITLKDATGKADYLASKEIASLTTVDGWLRSILEDTSLPKANIIRAACIDSEGNTGPVVTETYWVGHDPAAMYGVPVLSLVVDPDDLLDYETGIMAKGAIYDEWIKTPEGQEYLQEEPGMQEVTANFSQHGKAWERNAYISMFDEAGSLQFEQNAGIRIRGGFTRSLPQKSFNLYFRKDYGSGTLKYALFDDAKDLQGNTITAYKKFALRNGGNDAQFLMFRDCLIQNLLKDRSFGTQESYPVILFLNGEYWGVYTMLEVYDDQYCESHYGVDRDNVVIIEEDELDEGEDEDILLYEEFKSYADKDLTDPEVWKAFSSTVDTENMAEYFAAEIYFGNEDFAPDKNIRLWRVRTPGYTCSEDDGRWRFMMYDTEYCAGLYLHDNTSSGYDHYAAALEHFPVFASVMKNAEFRNLFLNKIKEIGSVNFAPERVNEEIAALAAQYRPLMQDHYLRFGGNYTIWDSEYEHVQQYFKERYDLIIPMIEKDLEDSSLLK
ncbi:MAG: CotH kinase family protein [Solobacterium sp.]|nr:CotH kinase family protein [Solobacterium sp.]